MMECLKIINLLGNAQNQPSKNWVEINDDSRRKYDFSNQIRFKTSIQKLSVVIVVNIYL